MLEDEHRSIVSVPGDSNPRRNVLFRQPSRLSGGACIRMSLIFKCLMREKYGGEAHSRAEKSHDTVRRFDEQVTELRITY